MIETTLAILLAVFVLWNLPLIIRTLFSSLFLLITLSLVVWLYLMATGKLPGF